MDTAKLAQEAREMVTSGNAKDITQAIGIVTRRALDQIAGTYAPRAERDWINDVARVERATRDAR